MQEIRWHRIKAIFIYHALSIAHVPFRFMVVFYWSFINIILWGYSGIWAQAQVSNALHVQHVAVALLFNVVLWQLVVRTSYNIALSMYQEISASNLVSLYATPLMLAEWSLAIILLTTFLLGIMLLFLVGVAWFIYAQFLFALGWQLIPILVSLTFAGMAVGFFSSAFVVTGGIRTEELVYMLAWALAFFSGIFYTLDTLPAWAQAIAWCMPMAYAFEAMRVLVATGSAPVHLLLMSGMLSILYFAGTVLLFFWAFGRSRARGLARLEQ